MARWKDEEGSKKEKEGGKKEGKKREDEINAPFQERAKFLLCLGDLAMTWNYQDLVLTSVSSSTF